MHLGHPYTLAEADSAMQLRSNHHKWLIPCISFVLFTAATLFLWRDRNDHDREVVVRYIETAVDQVRIRVEGLMNASLSSLELMADRWVERQPPDFSRERFEGFAAALNKHYPSYVGIFWIDPTGVFQWGFPGDDDDARIGRQMSECLHPRPAAGLDAAIDATDIVVTPCTLSPWGDTEFHAVRPLMRKKRLQGYLDGAFSVERIMSLCLPRALRDDFQISVSEGQRTIYRHGGAGPRDENGLLRLPRAVREIRFGHKLWTLVLTPDRKAYPDASGRNLVFLVFGLTLSAALSLLLHLLMKRMEMYKASRDEAMREINEREKAQAALTDNESQLQALLAELRAKNAELESFVYTVSHDLKTPIVTIDGFIGALREDFGDRISAEGKQYLRYMSDAARKMERLIKDLLNLSRIGRLEETKTSFPIQRPLKDALAMLQPQIDVLGIAVHIQDNLPTVHADRKRIQQVWYNLLSNAVKYIGAENPTPRIDIGCMARAGERIFWMRDNGIGIDHRYFEKIFQVFERLPPAKAAGEGTGIGLAIVKRIIEHHGGRIWLDSEPGRGTTFYFTLNERSLDDIRSHEDLDR